jgi:flagellar protein FlbD
MIEVTRLDGSPIFVNADLIETVQRTPDTILGLANGNTVMVREAVGVVIERVLAYKRAVHAGPVVIQDALAVDDNPAGGRA